ncbi:MAG TPA: CocE/NonD family hydrolase [Candidatus Thermoplasmatota archaeon]|nr:CocE/NonD family hydrolase [Candidatus Thermoplasmatota archaeon]
MRALLLLTALVVPLLAGCLQSPAPTQQIPPVALGSVAIPQGAVAEAVAGGVALVWKSAALPFASKVTLPQHATMVRLVADPGAAGSVNVGMSSAESGRRRCNNPTVTDFDHAILGPKSCSYLTAIDPAGAAWNVAASGAGATRVANVRVEFLALPVDGLAARLDLSQLSQPTHKLQATTTQFVPSFDGTRLRVEVTLPEGAGPWPTLLESSPYHDDGKRADPASYAYFVKDWAARGYAVAVADVRGFGDSGGCVEVWGRNEQKDQAFLVEWAAQQPWSDGNVGFYGQSYVATTPVEAAVQAPPHLRAIIAVAPVVRNYDDWHFGGVPNGENLLSPVGYAVLTDATVEGAQAGQPPAARDPGQMLNNLGNGPCDPADLARPNDPRALFDAYYVERDFAARAKDIKAAVLFTHGFEDANVKAQMIPDWFNAIAAPKLGLFGHWLHQHPPRMDQEVLFLGWMDQYVKGKPLGFERLPKADVLVDPQTHRETDSWPTAGTAPLTRYLDLAGGKLADAPATGQATVVLDSSDGAAPLAALGATALEFSGPIPQPFALSGNAILHVLGTLDGAANGYLAADLIERATDGNHLITWGQVNLAHNADHTAYAPIPPGQVVSTELPLRPTEHVFAAGSILVLRLHGVAATTDPTDPYAIVDPYGIAGAQFTFLGGDNGVKLVMPTLPLDAFKPIPVTATP